MLRSLKYKNVFLVTEFGACCVADICLMMAEIIVCKMLMKSIKLCL